MISTPIVSKVWLVSKIEVVLTRVLFRKMNGSVLLLRRGSQLLFIGENFKLDWLTAVSGCASSPSHWSVGTDRLGSKSNIYRICTVKSTAF